MALFKFTNNPFKMMWLKLISKLSNNSGWKTVRSDRFKMTLLKFKDKNHIYIPHETKANWARLCGIVEGDVIPKYVNMTNKFGDHIDSLFDDLACITTKHDDVNGNLILKSEISNKEKKKLQKEKDRVAKKIDHVRQGSLSRFCDVLNNTSVDRSKIEITKEGISVDPNDYNPLTNEQINNWPNNARMNPSKIEENGKNKMQQTEGSSFVG